MKLEWDGIGNAGKGTLEKARAKARAKEKKRATGKGREGTQRDGVGRLRANACCLRRRVEDLPWCVYHLRGTETLRSRAREGGRKPGAKERREGTNKGVSAGQRFVPARLKGQSRCRSFGVFLPLPPPRAPTTRAPVDGVPSNSHPTTSFPDSSSCLLLRYLQAVMTHLVL